jgi:hypothetical protein
MVQTLRRVGEERGMGVYPQAGAVVCLRDLLVDCALASQIVGL